MHNEEIAMETGYTPKERMEQRMLKTNLGSKCHGLHTLRHGWWLHLETEAWGKAPSPYCTQPGHMHPAEVRERAAADCTSWGSLKCLGEKEMGRGRISRPECCDPNMVRPWLDEEGPSACAPASSCLLLLCFSGACSHDTARPLERRWCRTSGESF